jgi:hypothetical protein
MQRADVDLSAQTVRVARQLTEVNGVAPGPRGRGGDRCWIIRRPTRVLLGGGLFADLTCGRTCGEIALNTGSAPRYDPVPLRPLTQTR